MKNKLTIFLSVSLLLLVTLGCGLGGLIGGGSDSESSKDESGTTKSDGSSKQKEAKPSGDVVKVGIQECDEFATYINDNAKEFESESYVVQGLVKLYKQTILSNLRESVEKMNDEQKTKMGENCKKALEELKKSMNK